ncbi:uncharacterized protein LOC108914619 [Anoplophora glabripennis]|uniref:uncharacterized protein LOC108914619 n=1 Tax=Anoplophora glabripennis TaxID=217634 RepID=UPI000873E8B1|nr:uncharacterized protein LOC108914619 [Anoplophora glabripennis]
MVIFLRFLVTSCLVFCIDANFTKVSRNNILLSRRKRYVAFPMGSNLVISMAAVKAFLQVQPTGWNILFEVDVPFALPSEPLFFKKKKKHKKERRSIYSQLDTALTESGLNGTACVRRIICDAQQFIPTKGKSLVKDLLLAIFTSSEPDYDENYQGHCDRDSWTECEVPFLDFILKSFEMRETS